MEAGYMDLKMIVVKFWRGLDPQIQDAMATMAHGHLSDTSPDSWYEAAQNIDQNCAANKAFNSTHQTPAPIIPCNDLPTQTMIALEELQRELTDRKDMAQMENSLTNPGNLTTWKKDFAPNKPAKGIPLLSTCNHFKILSNICDSKTTYQMCKILKILQPKFLKIPWPRFLKILWLRSLSPFLSQPP